MYPISGNAYDGKASAKNQKTLNEAVSSNVEPNHLSEIAAATLPQELETVKATISSHLGAACTLSAGFADPRLIELEEVLAGVNLRDEPRDKVVDRATKLVQAYLLKNEPQFKRVMEYRDRGWNNNKGEGDSYFQKQRAQADNTEGKGEKIFYDLMIRIAEEMHRATGALSPLIPTGRILKVLDICMAPGGYSAAVLKVRPEAEIYGVTLPKAEGGHSVVLNIGKLKGLKQCDVTMLATELLSDTDKIIPKGYPDAAKINPFRPFRFHKMDLVLLDGQVLRTHERASFRQWIEPVRLRTAQLILAMQRIAQGGTLIMLMHKVENWLMLNVVYAFSKFAKVELFKPTSAHTTRSSFYMVAKEVDVKSSYATAALAEWKEEWYTATFGGPEGTGEAVGSPEDAVVLDVLKTFGQKLIQMGVPLWRTQADALAKTSYAGDLEKSVVIAREEV